MQTDFEVVIIGGGPAGLSAALAAARARRRVLVVDGGVPRNAAAPAIHTFVTRDGIVPADFRRIAREQIEEYPTIEFAQGFALDIGGEAGSFSVTVADGRRVTAARLLLATGLVDTLPDVAGVQENWGRGVHHCPYCDGYEHRDRTWGILADLAATFEHIPFFTAWTRDIIVFTNGAAVPEESQPALEQAGIRVETGRIARVVGGGAGQMESVELIGGRRVQIESLWVRAQQRQADIVLRLGVTLKDDGAVVRDDAGETSIPGIFAAGDLSAGPAQQALLAAADGTRVMFGINRQLVLEHVLARST